MLQLKHYNFNSLESVADKMDIDATAFSLLTVIDSYCSSLLTKTPLFHEYKMVVAETLQEELDACYEHWCKKDGVLIYDVTFAEATDRVNALLNYNSNIKLRMPLTEHIWVVATLTYLQEEIVKLLPLPETKVLSPETVRKVFCYVILSGMIKHCYISIADYLLGVKLNDYQAVISGGQQAEIMQQDSAW